MPVLDNPKHERFAQELSKGKTADEAYVLAGYKADRGNASRLTAKDNVIARVAEIQDRGAMRAEVTVESLIAEAEEVRAAALADKQYAAAISAIREKGVLSGKRVERAEMGGPGDFARMNEDELDGVIASEIRALGLGSAGEADKGQSSRVLGLGRPN